MPWPRTTICLAALMLLVAPAAQGMTRPQWEDSLAWMTRRHNMPPLEGRDRDVVLDYLAATFPPRGSASPGGWRNPFAK